eukprot:4585015-Pyramimonas_sp.AAC.1
MALPANLPICKADPTGCIWEGSMPCSLSSSSARNRRLWEVTQKPAPRDHVKVGEKSNYAQTNLAVESAGAWPCAARPR